MTENGKRPIRILIELEQHFSMFLVLVLPDEQWKTSGDFYLRFLRRIPVTTKRSTFAYIDGPLAGPNPHRPIPRPATHRTFEESIPPTPTSPDTYGPVPRGRFSLSRVPSTKSNSSSLEEPPSGQVQQRRRKEKLRGLIQKKNYPLAQAIGLGDAVFENELPDMSTGSSGKSSPEAKCPKIRVHPSRNPDDHVTDKPTSRKRGPADCPSQ